MIRLWVLYSSRTRSLILFHKRIAYNKQNRKENDLEASGEQVYVTLNV